ncbi:MAG: hypothetical protein JNM17_18110 [Archangium sp.]|nr:hypothetical protein [Archangium sp.]
MKRLLLISCLAFTSCVDFDAKYRACVDAGRCTDDAGILPDAGDDAGLTDAGADAGPQDAGDVDAGLDAGTQDAGFDAGAPFDPGTWLEISPIMDGGGRFGAPTPFGPDITTSATSLSVAYRQFGEVPPGETPRHFAVRRFDGGTWALDTAASNRMDALAAAQGVPFPPMRSFDSPFDRALIAETDLGMFFAPDSYSGGGNRITNNHFAMTGTNVVLDFAHTGSALAARGNQAWVAMRRCLEIPMRVEVVVSEASASNVVSLALGNVGTFSTCIDLQNTLAFDLRVGAPTITVNPTNGLRFVAFAAQVTDGGVVTDIDGGMNPRVELQMHAALTSNNSWTRLDSASTLTADQLPIESVVALSPAGASGALLAFEDRAPQPGPRQRVRSWRVASGSFTDPGNAAGTNLVAVKSLNSMTERYVWDRVNSLATLEVAGRSWVLLSVLAGIDGDEIFLVSIGPNESQWRTHTNPLTGSGQINDPSCEISRARLSSWQNAPVVTWAQRCFGGPRTDLVVMWLRP